MAWPEDELIIGHYASNAGCGIQSPGLDAGIAQGTLLSNGVKNDQDKQRWDLIPASLEEVVRVYTIGATKYADRNWELGIAWHRVFGAMMRHAWAWWWGEQRHEKGMHHLASVAWCALALMEYENTHKELDNRPYGGK